MKQYYAIDIRNDYATVLLFKKKRDVVTVVDSQIVNILELKDFLDSRYSFYLSVEMSEVFDERVDVPSAIKNDSVIKNFILKKFKDSISDEKDLFNYYEVEQNEHDSTTTYQVDGVESKKYIEKLLLTGNLNSIKSSTTAKFALFGLSEKCIKEESYLSIYTQAKKFGVRNQISNNI